MFKFREIGRNNTEPFTVVNHGFDPDRRVWDADVIIEEDNDRRNEEKFDPDKRVNWD
nr:MAG TPA: hypothetical protein [Caudoviricetes sp.]